MTTIRALVLILIGVAVGSLIRSVQPRLTSRYSKSASDSPCRMTSSTQVPTARSSKFGDHSCDVSSPSLMHSAVFLRT